MQGAIKTQSTNKTSKLEGYEKEYLESIKDPAGFWEKAASRVHWYHKWDKALEVVNGHYRWFVGGCMNTCYNALDLHIEHGNGDKLALIYDSPVTDTKKTFTYKELRDRVSKTANILVNKGVNRGDRVVIYMPMIPEAVIAMLACARIGAVHSVVFGGFAAHELASRIEDAKPRVIISASCGIEVSRIIKYKIILDEAIKQSSHKPTTCLIHQRPQDICSMLPWRDVDWAEEEKKVKGVDCVPLDSLDPLYILYTSGTTGKPKGVIRSNGGHSVAMKWSMDNIYKVKSGDVMFTASDVGWVVGHSYIVYATLMSGATTVLYEGKPVKTPDPGAFFRVCEEYKVNVLFTAPTAFRAIRKEDPEGSFAKKYNLESLREVFVAGERCDTDTLSWIEKITGKKVFDNYWQTETGWPIASNGVVTLMKPGSAGVAMPGFNVKVLDEEGKECESGTQGNLVLKLPLPPACLMGIWEDEERYKKSYLDHYKGYYLTGDSGYKDKDGYIFAMGRMDGVLNVAGHRLSTGAIEEAILKHPDIVECAVVGVDDTLKGEVPLAVCVMKQVERDLDSLKQGINTLVREEIGAIATLSAIAFINVLPKTRSGKILRNLIANIACGKEYDVPSTIEDVSVIDNLKEVLKDIGFPRTKTKTNKKEH
ncbi:propionyl-CoA synthetase [Helicobacter sp. 13S00401-1]|uniref:AMP-binding protein n=1 Tax=Helicobacter sp. 13S00401-1 TaxID=1905758 RepID=UPI000BA64CCD|nr:AMP-binding protein [Helicobacter sp. 13S00401-1]PAF50878.1 propionyl-CoA synthetase [Helicobacter sp. 13S00401-1]